MVRTSILLPEPDKSAYANFQSSAKDFYNEAATEKWPASAKLLQIDPLDIGDPHVQKAVATVEGELYGRMRVPRQHASFLRQQIVSDLAMRTVQVDRYAAKAFGSDRIATLADWYRDNAIISLFPAYIETRIQQGLIAASLVPELIFADVPADSTKAVATYNSTAASERSLREIEEGAELPSATISAADSTINLRKFGRAVSWTYESVRGNFRIDWAEHNIRRVGEQIGVDETDWLLHVLIAGDGTTAGRAETNATDTDVASAGTITFTDLLNWYFSVPSSAYKLDKAVAGKTDLRQIADLAEFSDIEYVQGQASLRIPTPVAMTYYWWDGGVTGSAYVDRLVIGVDSRNAAMAYTFGGFIQETDNIITRQVTVATMSYWRGFRKFDADAVKVLDANAAL